MTFAVEAAGLSAVARRAILALHSDTFFVVQGQTDRVRTRHGSPPGDSYTSYSATSWHGFLQSLRRSLNP